MPGLFPRDLVVSGQMGHRDWTSFVHVTPTHEVHSSHIWQCVELKLAPEQGGRLCQCGLRLFAAPRGLDAQADEARVLWQLWWPSL